MNYIRFFPFMLENFESLMMSDDLQAHLLKPSSRELSLGKEKL